MSVAAAWCRDHPARTWCALALLCLAVPCATELWGGHAWTDIREDGTHEANHSPGWHTLRYFLLDGAYPLLPWAAFPLLGLRFASARGDRPRLRRWLFGGLLAAAVGLLLDRFGDAAAGGFAVHLDVTWQPTSLPFLLLWGGLASASLASLYLLGVRAAAVAAVGRRSLQHYLAHLVLVFWPMTYRWPEEDWSWGTGAGVALGYAAFALIWTMPRVRVAAAD